MEPETKLEAMTYLVSFTYYSLTTSAYPFPPFQYPSPSLPAFFWKKKSRNTFLLTSSTLFNFNKKSSPKLKATNHHT